jgi:probable rRNA maturation factor
MRVTLVCAPGCQAPHGTRAPIAAAAAALRPASLRVQVVLAGDALLRRLNRRYRRRDRATDVLSFRYGAAPGTAADPDVDAEVYVSLRRATVQAAAAGRTRQQEVVLLVLHGLLHLQGHDHHAPGARRRMHAAEVAALGRLARRWPAFALEPMLAPVRRRGGRTT